MRGRLAHVLAVALALLALPLEARADPAAEARFHDERGRQHYAAGRYEAALREFFAEQRLAPSARTIYNIALCFERLRRREEAFLFFTEYLGSSDDDAQRRRFAGDAVRRIEPTLALVEVRSEPAGATIYVDRRERGSYGAAPRVLPVAAGAHRLELALDGYEPAFIDVEARVGQRVEAVVRLRRVLGQLAIEGPAGARVEVRDATGALVQEGTLPATAELPPGDVVVDVVAEGHEPWRGLARVEAGGRASVRAEPIPRPPPTGELVVTASSAGALVTVDGEAAGFAPAVLAGLSLGAHRVRLEQPGLVPWEDEVEVTGDERAWLTVTLEPPPRTDRSPATWVLGGIGASALVGAIVTGAFAVDQHSQWVAAPDPTVRSTGQTLAIATDVLLVSGVVALATAVVLWFATEYVDQRPSRGTVSRGER